MLNHFTGWTQSINDGPGKIWQVFVRARWKQCYHR